MQTAPAQDYELSSSVGAMKDKKDVGRDSNDGTIFRQSSKGKTLGRCHLHERWGM